MSDLVSIIVPVYNVESYLRTCIDSLLCQTYGKIEIILVDDGSTDGSGHICDDYGIKNINVRTIHLKNSGVSSARNTGIKMAEGEFIICVDSDDYVEPSMIKSMVELINKYDADVAICAIELFNTLYRGKRRSRIQNYLKGYREISKEELYIKASDFALEPYYGAPYNKLIRRNVIIENNLLYEKGASIAEDTGFNYTIFSHINRMAVCEDVLYHHRINAGNSLSRKKYLHSEVRKRCVSLEHTIVKFCKLNAHASDCIDKKYKSQVFNFYVHKVLFDCSDLKFNEICRELKIIDTRENLYSGQFHKLFNHEYYKAYVCISMVYKIIRTIVRDIFVYSQNIYKITK